MKYIILYYVLHTEVANRLYSNILRRGGRRSNICDCDSRGSGTADCDTYSTSVTRLINVLKTRRKRMSELSVRRLQRPCQGQTRTIIRKIIRRREPLTVFEILNCISSRQNEKRKRKKHNYKTFRISRVSPKGRQ